MLQVQRTPDNRAQLAWHIRPGFSTQEHKTRAVQGVLNHAFYTHGLKHLQSHIAGDNATAIYALEHNGFMRSTEQAPNARRQVFEIEAPGSYEALLMQAS